MTDKSQNFSASLQLHDEKNNMKKKKKFITMITDRFGLTAELKGYMRSGRLGGGGKFKPIVFPQNDVKDNHRFIGTRYMIYYEYDVIRTSHLSPKNVSPSTIIP